MEEPAPWLNLARIALLRQRPADVRRCLELARDECDEAAAYRACLEGLRRSPAHAEL